MASLHRSTLSLIARRSFCGQTSPPTAAAVAADPFLSKLLREPDAAVKTALDSAPPPTSPTYWETLVSSLAASSPRKAHLVLEWKLEKLLKEDVRDRDRYSNLISLSSVLNHIPFAMRVFAAMETRGIKPNTCIFNSLISTCLSARDFVTALSLFEIMGWTDNCSPDITTYNAFIAMHSSKGDHQCMMDWYSAARNAGLSPDVQTYESLISGFVRAGRFDDADRYYQEMVSSDFLPSVVALEAMIEGVCRRKDVSRIKEFLKLMADGGWELKGETAAKLLELYLEMGLVEQMEELVSLMKHSQDLCILTRVHSGIIRMYAKLDRLDDMENSIGRISQRGMLLLASEDVQAVICALFRRKEFKRLDMFLERIRGSHKLSRSTYDLLVAGYRKFELHGRMSLAVEDMKRAGFLLGTESLNCTGD